MRDCGKKKSENAGTPKKDEMAGRAKGMKWQDTKNEKESMRMKKDIRAYEYEELQKRAGTSRRKTVSGKTRYMNGCM